MGEGGPAVRRGSAKEGAQNERHDRSTPRDRLGERRGARWRSDDRAERQGLQAWRERFDSVLRLLGPSGGGWGEVKLAKGSIRVKSLQPQAAGDLRHFLESLVVQVNAELPTEEGDGQDDDEAGAESSDRGAILDAEMTATLRSFAEAQA
jgi:hypothetical protein